MKMNKQQSERLTDSIFTHRLAYIGLVSALSTKWLNSGEPKTSNPMKYVGHSSLFYRTREPSYTANKQTYNLKMRFLTISFKELNNEY